MRHLVAVLCLLIPAGAAMASTSSSPAPRPKDSGMPFVNPPLRITGDTVADPFSLTPLPCTVTGTTASFANDYDEACPYTGSTAPDVVYRYNAETPLVFCVDLCHSGYDTKVYVYQDAVTPGLPIACNDDYYFAPPCYLYTSFLGNVPASAGHTYYIVIDGYGSASGAYTCTVTNGCYVPPLGACCDAGGGCTMTIEGACAGVWQGEDTACDPNPCEPVPADATSWGGLKHLYR